MTRARTTYLQQPLHGYVHHLIVQPVIIHSLHVRPPYRNAYPVMAGDNLLQEGREGEQRSVVTLHYYPSSIQCNTRVIVSWLPMRALTDLSPLMVTSHACF